MHAVARGAGEIPPLVCAAFPSDMIGYGCDTSDKDLVRFSSLIPFNTRHVSLCRPPAHCAPPSHSRRPMVRRQPRFFPAWPWCAFGSAFLVHGHSRGARPSVLSRFVPPPCERVLGRSRHGGGSVRPPRGCRAPPLGAPRVAAGAAQRLLRGERRNSSQCGAVIAAASHHDRH